MDYLILEIYLQVTIGAIRVPTTPTCVTMLTGKLHGSQPQYLWHVSNMQIGTHPVCLLYLLSYTGINYTYLQEWELNPPLLHNSVSVIPLQHLKKIFMTSILYFHYMIHNVVYFIYKSFTTIEY